MRWYRGSTPPGHRGGPGGRETLASRFGVGRDVDEGVVEYSLEELREFLEADLADVHADLEFKESLRRKLWDLVQAQNLLRARRADRG